MYFIKRLTKILTIIYKIMNTGNNHIDLQYIVFYSGTTNPNIIYITAININVDN